MHHFACPLRAANAAAERAIRARRAWWANAVVVAREPRSKVIRRSEEPCYICQVFYAVPGVLPAVPGVPLPFLGYNARTREPQPVPASNGGSRVSGRSPGAPNLALLCVNRGWEGAGGRAPPSCKVPPPAWRRPPGGAGCCRQNRVSSPFHDRGTGSLSLLPHPPHALLLRLFSHPVSMDRDDRLTVGWWRGKGGRGQRHAAARQLRNEGARQQQSKMGD